MKTFKKLEEVCRARGWAESRLLSPVAGVGNEIVIEWEYPDLATFQKEMDSFLADQEAFQLFRAGGQYFVEGSIRNELLEEVPMNFPGSD
ncbi:MAG TPA: hypothetical protein VND83_07305 [Acidimicrobiales bacterium]|nr:hypothetical protein [Acidimicrobiales bacterium]